MSDLSSAQRSICILAFSTIAHDGRVLRQIEYLAPHYNLTVVGYGPPHPAWADHPRVRWVRVPEVHPIAVVWRDLQRLTIRTLLERMVSEVRRAIFFVTLWLGRIVPPLYDFGYRLRWCCVGPLDEALATPHDAFHANDWDTVVLAARAARRHRARLVVDLHEYAPRQWENRPRWHLNERMIRYLLAKYAPAMDAVTTVAPLLAARYADEFGLAAEVVMNAPRARVLPAHGVDPENIRIVHHGLASAVRRPDLMIETIALADSRYSLHFMFLDAPYVDELKQLAAERAPGRVIFHAAVAPEQIVARIAEFDVGFILMPPVTFNYEAALPNKFLESIGAGLAVLIGPSPSMAAIVDQDGVGLVAHTFEPAAFAALLNRTSVADWQRMRTAARTAAGRLNADHEMQKVLAIYARLLDMPLEAVDA